MSSVINTYIRLFLDFESRFCPIFGQAEKVFFATSIRSFFDEKSYNKLYIHICVKYLIVYFVSCLKSY